MVTRIIYDINGEDFWPAWDGHCSEQSKAVLSTPTGVQSARRCWEFSAKAMPETLKGVLALYLTFDSNSRHYRDFSWRFPRSRVECYYTRKQSILSVVDKYALVCVWISTVARLILMNGIVDRSHSWHIQPKGLSIKEIEQICQGGKHLNSLWVMHSPPLRFAYSPKSKS